MLPKNIATEITKQRSQAVLDTAVKMVIDSAQDHLKNTNSIHTLHALPLCCACNLRDARTQIDDLHSSAGNEAYSIDRKSLIALEKAFCMQWRPAGVL